MNIAIDCKPSPHEAYVSNVYVRYSDVCTTWESPENHYYIIIINIIVIIILLLFSWST